MKFIILTLALITPLLSAPAPQGKIISSSKYPAKQAVNIPPISPPKNPSKTPIKTPPTKISPVNPQPSIQKGKNPAKVKSSNLQEDSEHSMQDAIDAAEDLVIKMKEKQASLAEEDNLFGPGNWLYKQVSTLANKV